MDMDTLLNLQPIHKGILCRYDITVTYEGEINVNLHHSAIFARLLVVGQVTRLMTQTRPAEIPRTAANCLQWKLGDFFPISSAPASFTIYVGLQNSQEEGILLEAKFHYQSLQADYDWDIVQSHSVLGEGLHISLEAHHMDFHTDKRIVISHETKTRTTSLYATPSTNADSIPPAREKQSIQNLLDSPSCQERDKALRFVSPHILAHCGDDVHFLDLVCQALLEILSFQGQRSLRSQSFLCSLLFLRSAFSDCGSFVDNAVAILKELDGTLHMLDRDSLIRLSRLVFQVVQQQKRAECADIALQVLTPPLCALAENPHGPQDEQLYNAVSAAYNIAIGFYKLDRGREKAQLGHALLFLRSIDTPEPLRRTLPQAAMSYLWAHERSVPPVEDPDGMLSLMESTRSYVVERGDLEGTERELLPLFFIWSTTGLSKNMTFTGQHDATFVTRLIRYYTFLTWATSYAESGFFAENPKAAVADPLWNSRRSCAKDVLFCFILHVLRPYAQRGTKTLSLGAIGRIIYGELLRLKEGDIEVMAGHMLCLVDGRVPQPSPRLAHDGIIKHSLSTVPRDEIALLRVIVAGLIARSLGLPDTLKAYELYMSSVDFRSLSTFDLNQRHLLMSGLAPFTSDAISYALELGDCDLALEWADQSFSLVWGQILHLRSPFTQVAAFDSGLAQELKDAASRTVDAQAIDFEAYPRGRDYYLSCLREWEDYITKARKLPGLDQLLCPKTFPDILSAAEALGGPVVYLNVNRYSCDALCILPNLGEGVHIPLPDLSFQMVRRVSRLFRHLLRGTGRQEVSLKRLGKLVQNPSSVEPQVSSAEYIGFPDVLAYLWDTVVKPVLDGLAIQRSESQCADGLPRIWWCPSGPLALLPLHAAGRYNNPPDDNILDYVVSSYIPSASVISHITRPEDAPVTANPHFLAIANPQGCGLPGTMRDLHVIRNRVVSVPLVELVGPDATVEGVVQELTAASWVHFACHGAQHVYPVKSALILADHARLTLAEITKLSLPQAKFAFLSACQTAKGMKQVYNESAHLTGVMLVAGFRSVIGTMWKISDYYAPEFADGVYKKLFEGNQTPDYRRAAFALHDAVKALRREKNLDFDIWVPFIHAGA